VSDSFFPRPCPKRKTRPETEFTTPHRVKEVFKTTLKSLIPLSNPSAPLSSESHPSRYPEYPPGHKIAAIYPGTSCFYRGTVFRSPVPVQGGQAQGGKKGKYVIVFEEDGGSQTEVEFELVLDVSRLVDEFLLSMILLLIQLKPTHTGPTIQVKPLDRRRSD
jgi:hypothetical protein